MVVVDRHKNELRPGDKVIYYDKWPRGSSVYIGKISHIVPSGRLAIRGETKEGDIFAVVNTYRSPNKILKFKENGSRF